jgi:predicted acylesterase/phospholipase RssA
VERDVRAALLAAVLALAACAHGPAAPRRPTCLVLSVGGPDGVAHLGALAAIRDARLPVAAVVGNSMGALVGALYASAPAEETGPRFRRLLDAYVAESEREARRNGVGLALLFGAVAAVASGGEPATTLLAGGGGFLLGTQATAKLDRDRLVRVMAAAFGGARIEALPLPFATFYQRPNGAGVELVAARSGDLAEAVGGSVANPFLFPGLSVRDASALDPGADRAAATPIDDACRLFPKAEILAVNVTGHPAFYSPGMRCPLREVTVAPQGVSAEDLLRAGPGFERAVAAGYRAMAAALSPR